MFSVTLRRTLRDQPDPEIHVIAREQTHHIYSELTGWDDQTNKRETLLLILLQLNSGNGVDELFTHGWMEEGGRPGPERITEQRWVEIIPAQINTSKYTPCCLWNVHKFDALVGHNGLSSECSPPACHHRKSISLQHYGSSLTHLSSHIYM